MRNAFPIATLAIVAAAAMSSTAQTPAASQRVSVTGCIVRGASDSQTRPTGTTATAPGPDTKFVLADVETQTKPADTVSRAEPGSIADARSYRIDDADQDKIAPHLGHRVEISGTVEQQAPHVVGTTGSTTPTDAIAPKLKVETLRMIAAECPKK